MTIKGFDKENGKVCKVYEDCFDDYTEFVKMLADQLAVMKITKKKMTKCHFEIGSFKIFNFVCSKPLTFYKLVVIGAKGNFSALKKVYDSLKK